LRYRYWIVFDRFVLTFHFIVNVVAMEITYTVAGLTYGALILHRVWDYAITVTVIHIGLSCLGKFYLFIPPDDRVHVENPFIQTDGIEGQSFIRTCNIFFYVRCIRYCYMMLLFHMYQTNCNKYLIC